MAKIKITGISLVPTGVRGSICGQSETMAISVFFTNYSAYCNGGQLLVKKFGPTTKSILLANIIFLSALIYSWFVNGV